MLLGDLGFLQQEATFLFCDNEQAAALANTNSVSQGNKHVDLCECKVRECIDRRVIRTGQVVSKFNPADLLTKNLEKGEFKRLIDLFMRTEV